MRNAVSQTDGEASQSPKHVRQNARRDCTLMDFRAKQRWSDMPSSGESRCKQGSSIDAAVRDGVNNNVSINAVAGLHVRDEHFRTHCQRPELDHTT
jgi:adenine C2-methylase RlmN of 23S rRNA A2503 and tRNA A37